MTKWFSGEHNTNRNTSHYIRVSAITLNNFTQGEKQLLNNFTQFTNKKSTKRRKSTHSSERALKSFEKRRRCPDLRRQTSRRLPINTVTPPRNRSQKTIRSVLIQRTRRLWRRDRRTNRLTSRRRSCSFDQRASSRRIRPFIHDDNQ